MRILTVAGCCMIFGGVFGISPLARKKFMTAVQEGDLIALQRLVPKVIKPNDVIKNGRTALVIVRKAYDEESARWLSYLFTSKKENLKRMGAYLQGIEKILKTRKKMAKRGHVYKKKKHKKKSKKMYKKKLKKKYRKEVIHTAAVVNTGIKMLYQQLKKTGGSQWKPSEEITIAFYDKEEPFYEFSPYYPKPIAIDGVTFKTLQHYYQMLKFRDSDIQQKIRAAPTALRALKVGYTYREKVRRDWENVPQATKEYPWLATSSLESGGISPWKKDIAMIDAVRARFSEKSLRSLLLGTGDAYLVYYAPGHKQRTTAAAEDEYWGWHPVYNPTGYNMLGKLLMHVRGDLRAKTTTPFWPGKVEIRTAEEFSKKRRGLIVYSTSPENTRF